MNTDELSKNFFNYIISRVNNKKVLIYGKSKILEEALKLIKMESTTVLGPANASDGKSNIINYKNKAKEYHIIIPFLKQKKNHVDFLEHLGYHETDYTFICEELKKYANNKICIYNKNSIQNVDSLANNDVLFVGRNNSLILHYPINLVKNKFKFKNNCCVEILSSSHALKNSLFSLAYDNCKISIGRDFSSGGCEFICGEPNCRIEVGDDCMFSNQISVRPSDGHSIYDIQSKKIQNLHKDIVLKNHIWIGYRVVLLKSACLSDNTIVGSGSIVTRKFIQKNIAIAGNPAKIIKENVNWSRINPVQYINKVSCK